MTRIYIPQVPAAVIERRQKHAQVFCSPSAGPGDHHFLIDCGRQFFQRSELIHQRVQGRLHIRHYQGRRRAFAFHIRHHDQESTRLRRRQPHKIVVVSPDHLRRAMRHGNFHARHNWR